jgi:uncharacterized membrane protein
MKLSWRVEAVQWALVAAMFAVAAASWPAAPERMPIHWNIHGEVDGYGSRFVGLLLLPIVALGVYALMVVLPRFDPLRANYASFAGAYNLIRIAILAFLAGIYVVTVLAALGYSINMTTVVGLGVAALFIVLGGTMRSIQPNWFVGVRTPWTLSSKLSWTKTHRLAGWVFVGLGILVGVWGWVQSGAMLGLMIAAMVLAMTWIVVYSYLVYRRDPDRLA